jgi:hypothetical protein
MDSTKLAVPFGAILFAGFAAAAMASGAGSSKAATLHSWRDQDAYVLSMGRRFTCTNTSLEEMQSLRRRFSGDFLWVRRAKTTYLFRDPDTLRQARAAFDPLRALDPDRETIHRLRAPIESRQAALDREQENLDREADRFADDEEEQDQRPADRDGFDRRRRALEERLRALEREERHVDALEEELDQKEEALENRAESELWRLIDAAIARGLARRIEHD